VTFIDIKIDEKLQTISLINWKSCNLFTDS